MYTFVSRLSFTVAAVFTAVILSIGPANAITIDMCVQGGGVVVRCSEQPITREDKVATCPSPGRTDRIWCVGGEYHMWEIIGSGGHSRYR